MRNALKGRLLPRTNAEIVGSVFGVAHGLVSPRLGPPPPGTMWFDDLYARHPFLFLILMVAWAGLCAAVMFIGIYIVWSHARPRMSDRRLPIFFRYQWAVFRWGAIAGMWAGIGLAVGLGVAMLLCALTGHPTLPYAYLAILASGSLSAGLAGLMATRLHPAR